MRTAALSKLPIGTIFCLGDNRRMPFLVMRQNKNSTYALLAQPITNLEPDSMCGLNFVSTRLYDWLNHDFIRQLGSCRDKLLPGPGDSLVTIPSVSEYCHMWLHMPYDGWHPCEWTRTPSNVKNSFCVMRKNDDVIHGSDGPCAVCRPVICLPGETTVLTRNDGVTPHYGTLSFDNDCFPVLEKEELDDREWQSLCRIMGLVPEKTDRIVLRGTVLYFGVTTDEAWT